MLFSIILDRPSGNNENAALSSWFASNAVEHGVKPVLPAIWFAELPFSAVQIRAGLVPLLGAGDRLLIFKCALEGVTHGFSDGVRKWFADTFVGSHTERIP